MSKPIPAVGATNWGPTLNAHLSQISKAETGGMNYGTTRPTGITEGYTFVDTKTRELLRYNGSAWEVLMGGVGKGRELLTANTTLYVNNNGGNNANDGRTPATAVATIQRAIDIAAFEMDNASYNVTIQLADSATPYAGGNRLHALPGTGVGYITGNTANRTSVTVGAADLGGGTAVCFAGSEGKWNLQNMKLIGNAPAPSITTIYIWMTGYALIYIREIHFAPSTTTTDNVHMASSDASTIYVNGNWEISGSGRNHINASNGGRVAISGGNPDTNPAICTVSANISFTQSFAFTYNWSQFDNFINRHVVTFNGANLVTGIKFRVDAFSQIAITPNANGDLNYLPGNQPGIIGFTSRYI